MQLMQAMYAPYGQWKPLLCQKRRKFTPYEDHKILELIDRFGEEDWKTIASFMVNRSVRQCKERYKNYLAPDIRRDPFSAEEEKLLEEKVKELGTFWSKITKYFVGRSEASLKNHYASMCNRTRTRRDVKHQGSDEDSSSR